MLIHSLGWAIDDVPISCATFRSPMQSLFDLINLCSYNVHIWEDPVVAVLDKFCLGFLALQV
jgi:hypothetical protein